MTFPEALIIVDVQRGFVNEHTQHILEPIEHFQSRFRIVVATRYYRVPGSAIDRTLSIDGFARGSPETELAFTASPAAIVVEKSEYSCVGSQLMSVLRAQNVQSACVCGVDTDQCVLMTAGDLLQHDVVPIVLEDLCASAAGPHYHEAGLFLLRRLIGEEQVRRRV